MDPDEAPPPYAAVDPLRSVANNGNVILSTNPHQPPVQLRGGEASIPFPATGLSDSSSTYSAGLSSSSLVSPVNFISAVGFFEERLPPPFQDRDVLQHHLTIYPKTQAKDFPRRPRCWNERADEINQQDWNTFLNFLFPPHLAPAAESELLPPRLRAEIQRDRKDRPQETDDERRLRISAVIAEWNQGFFLPRSTRISWTYVSDLESAPSSPLCPKCYPAATSASQNRRVTHSRSAENLAPQPAAAPTQLSPAQIALQANANSFNRVEPHNHVCLSSALKSLAPWPMFPRSPGWPRTAPPGPYPWPSPTWPVNPQSAAGQQWGPGPLGWIAEIGVHANRFAEHVTEQAHECERLIEENVKARGRWLEEQARNHGRQIEEQARSRGRQLEEIGRSFAGLGNRASFPYEWGPGSYNGPWCQRDPWTEGRGRGMNRHYRRGRSASAGSTSSASSFSSIDTISTIADLEMADLSSIRTQLSSLDGQHHRDLYAAALRLRHHLQALQQLRRHARLNGSRGGFMGRGPSRGGHWGGRGRGWPFDAHHHGFGHGGREPWEAPIELQHNPAERRAIKEEKKAVEKAFRDVVRRARDEAKEIRRNRRREERNGRRRDRAAQHLPNNFRSMTTPIPTATTPADVAMSSATRAFSSLSLSDAGHPRI